MEPSERNRFSAFVGQDLIARGDLRAVARAAHAHRRAQPVVLDDATGRTVDLNLEGSAADVEARFSALPATPPPARGRPKLGVTSREVTLLPRHWEWLSGQPGGASAALRRLVDQARQTNLGRDELRAASERVYRAMTTLCGDSEGYEEAARALFAGDREGFAALTGSWPADVRRFLHDLWG